MPVPSTLQDLSQTASSNYPAGSDSPTVLDDVQRAHASFLAQLRDGKGLSTATTLASATTTDIGGQNSQFVDVSGTTTITSFGTNYSGPRFLKFTGALTLTHNATSLILPGAANITTVAGDTAIAIPNQALNGWTVFFYQRSATFGANVSPRATRIDVASVAGTVDLTTNAPNTDDIRITGALAITAFTVASDRVLRVTAGGAFTLTNNANIVTQTGANIVAAAGDTFMLRATAANVVEVLNYVAVAGPSTAVLLTGAQTIAGVKTFSSPPVFASTPVTTAAQSMVRVDTVSGYGSTNTKIARFTNTITSQGADITYADSATLGGSFTINTSGVYAITAFYSGAAGFNAGVSLNTTAPTTNVYSIPKAELIAAAQCAINEYATTMSQTMYLAAGSVLRFHTAGVAFGTVVPAQFTVTRVA